MSVVISGRVVTAIANGTVLGQANLFVYLRPSRTDFQFSLDGGVTWQSWEGDPNLSTTRPGAIKATTNGTGDWSFTVPWTDSAIETRLPGGAPLPDLFWIISDPNGNAGEINYFGKTPQAVVGASKTIKDLITLASPDTWAVGAVNYAAVPAGERRRGRVAFTALGPATASVSFPTIGTSGWRVAMGVSSDDTTVEKTYFATLDEGSKTDVGCSVRISELPPAGKTVYVDIEVYQ
jgi:hypothetical protein